TDYISIIICCGNSGARYFNDVAVLNTQTWSWTQPNITGTAPMARSDHSSVMVNGQMIMFFGYNEPSAMYLNDVNVLDTRSTPFQWTGGFTPSPTSGSTPSPTGGSTPSLTGGFAPNTTSGFTPSPTTTMTSNGTEQSVVVGGGNGIGVSSVIGISVAGVVVAVIAIFLVIRKTWRNPAETTPQDLQPADVVSGLNAYDQIPPLNTYPLHDIPVSPPAPLMG
ncbi:hypothetical protein BC938DRAFT_482986, partial [Jimgerdemannia flammicorona]